MIKLIIKRKPQSWHYKNNPQQPDSFENNWKNNSLDDFVLADTAGNICFSCKCQSVANYCFGANATAITVPHGDTVMGKFTVKTFVPSRQFHGQIHAIINATDLDGEKIDCNAMQTTAGGYQNGRWLIHDRYSFAQKRDTTYAWSAGCIILSSKDLEQFNQTLTRLNYTPGTLLSGEIIETVC